MYKRVTRHEGKRKKQQKKIPKMKTSDFQAKINEKKILYQPIDGVAKNPEMIKRIMKRVKKQDAECKLNEKCCCVRMESNRNIIPAKKTIRNTG